MKNYDGIISLLIFCIELLLLINVWIFSKNKFKNLLLILLSLLASYQLFEFLICGLNFYEPFIVYLAFVIISYLPPLGLLLVMKINNIKLKQSGLIFSPAIFFTLFYFFTHKQFVVKKCTVLYVSYHYPLGFLYGLFYYLPMLIAVVMLIHNTLKSKSQSIKKENLTLLFGYFAFTIPMGIALLVYSEYLNAIESLLCKFALVFAVVISYFALHFKK